MIFITGASSGIGLATAQTFARRGHDLLLVARRQERIAEIAENISREFGVDARGMRLDVSDRAQVEAFFAAHGPLVARTKVLVNNAGLARGLSTFQDGELGDWDTMIDVNVKGLLYVTRNLLPYFQKNGAGHIVNVGSVAGHWVYPRGNIYCATKAAVHSLTEAMRIDLNGSGIRVTEISPGMVETDFSLVRLGDAAKAKAVYQGMTPLTAQDVADTIAWTVDRPAHVNIQEVVLYPTDQASPTIVHRRS